MASTETRESICNMAMLMLGGSFVSSLAAPSTPLQRQLALVYNATLKAELRKHRWVFAKGWRQLSQDPTWSGTEPRACRYAIPPAVERTILPKGRDWTIEGNHIYTDEDAALLTVQCISSDVPIANFDALFVPVLAAAIALKMVEAVTQSNTKKADVGQMYKDAIAEARKANAFEAGSDEVPAGSWAEQLGG
ncbi:hypothetical protein [Hyphomicrobium sp. DY-1]|uniref:hypothetical protein n=1 Tax=Hyphomicrobium sp. DY-1 TaxID=3075650 RepID=UPI0039C12650